MKKSFFYYLCVCVAATVSGFFLFFYLGNPEHALNNPWQTASAAPTTATVVILPALQTNAQGQIDYYALSISPVSATPNDARVGVTSTYDIGFSPNKSIPFGGSIVLVFPAGFGFSNSCSSILSVSENNDINGSSSGVVTISSIACNSSTQRVTIKTGGASIGAGDRVRFFVQGVVNAFEARDATTAGYSIGIDTLDVSGGGLGFKTSLPFYLNPAGSQRISGTVFNDNGSGLFGFAGDNVQGGSEPGISGIQVCLSGSFGSECQTTNAQGEYNFTGLNNGIYRVVIPPLTSGDIVGGPYFSDITLTGGQNKTGASYAFRSANRSLTVSVSGIPSGTSIEVFVKNLSGTQTGGSIVREFAWNGEQSRSVVVPVMDGTWNVGVQPFGSSSVVDGTGSSLNLSYIPPQPSQVQISGAGTYGIGFVLQSANKKIRGKVVNATNIGIPNVFMSARPSVLTAQIGKESSTQSLGDGAFELSVSTGTFFVDASMPGMAQVEGKEVTVKDDSGNSAIDGNPTADVYRGGTLITNDGDGGSDNIIFVIAQGDRSISGSMLDENGKPLTHAHVSAEKIDTVGNPTDSNVDAPTDGSGRFTLYVSDGQWKLHGYAYGYGEVGSRTVTVSGSNVSGQDIRASSSDFGIVEGTVTKNGQPLSGATINIFGASGKNSTVTDADGAYSLRMKAGTGYTIEGNAVNVGPLPKIVNVTVVAGVTLGNKNIDVQSPGTVTVTIPGVSNAFVRVFSSSGVGDGTSSNPTPGVYSVAMLPGTYTVVAQNSQYGVLGKRTDVVVRSGQTTAVQFLPPVSVVVTGRIISTEGMCLDGASVFFTDTVNSRVSNTVTDASGVYSLSLQDGTYRVSAGKQGCVDKEELLSVTVNGSPVSVQDRRLVPATSSLSGTVLLSGQNVSMDTKVTAENSEGTVVSANVNTAVSSGSNYTLALSPGTWVVRARTDGYESALHTVTALLGDNEALNLVLSAIPNYIRKERVLTPVQPSRGGIVRDENIGAGFELSLPAGALGSSSDSGSVSTKVTTAIVMKTSTASVLGGVGIEITPKDSEGRQIITLSSSSGSVTQITIPYSEEDVLALGGDESKLMIAVWSEESQQWQPLPTTVDTDNKTLTAMVEHFSVFAPILPVHTVTPVPSVVAVAPQVSQPASIFGTVLPAQPNPTPASPKSDSESSAVPGEKAANEGLPTFLIIPSPTIVEDVSMYVAPSSPGVGGVVVEGDQKEAPVAPGRPSGISVYGIVPSLQEKIQNDYRLFFEQPKIPIEVFEVSLFVDMSKRILDPGGDLTVHGMITKSDAGLADIPLVFIIRGKNNAVMAKFQETVSVGRAFSFSKTFHLDKTMPAGRYTIALESKYSDSSLSSTDTFQIKGLVGRARAAGTASAVTKIGLQEGIQYALFVFLLLSFLGLLWSFVRSFRHRA